MHITPNSSYYDQMIAANAAYWARLDYVRNIVVSCNIAIYVFASMANTLIILVFLKEGFKRTSNISFFALAVADMMISIIWTAYQIRMLTFFFLPFDPFQQYITNYMFPCAEAINTIGSWITVIITWERVFCIAYPLTVKRIFTRKMIASLYLGAWAYEIVAMAFYFTVDWLRLEEYKEVVIIHYWDNGRFRTNVTGGEKRFFYSKMQDIALMARSFIPNYILYALILIGTVMLVFIFRRSIQMKNSLTGSGSKNENKQEMSVKEKRVVKSVIAVCVIYLLTVTPLNVYNTYVFSGYKPTSILLLYYFELIRGLNHAVNIFVYLAVNNNFRRQFKNLFCFRFTSKSLNSK